jgi:Na+-transporting NADH:ubiquinone oxidoreductase subunit F
MPKHGTPTFRTLLLGVWLTAFAAAPRSAPADIYRYQARVQGITDLTHDTKRIRLQVADARGFTFKPGQYVFLKVPDEFVREWNQRYGTNHAVVARPYSFASPASRLPSFDWIIKRVGPPAGKDVPPGLASTYVHDRLRVGDVVRMSAPMGDLFLRRDTGRPILVVAGGTGAAPFVSLLEQWFEEGIDRGSSIHFFFGVRSRRDLFYHDRFTRWAAERKNFRYVPALSHAAPDDDWKGETGFVNQVVDRLVPAPSEADAYIAGPPIMVRETIKVLHAKGIADTRIHHDPIEVR